MNSDFNWGVTNEEYVDLFSRENFEERVYERHYRVKEGDIVVDIGTNYGSFAYSIKDSRPRHVYCIEPSNKIFDVLKENLSSMPCTFINKAIGEHDRDDSYLNEESFIYHHEGDRYSSIKFKTFVNDHNINRIDLLKFDCEGGEFHIFNDENIDLVKRVVKNISGEYHITHHKNSVKNFIQFRNNYLLELRGTNRLYVYDRDDNDITENIFSDEYIKSFEEFYYTNNPDKGQFMIHASFENVKPIPVIGAPVVTNPYWINRLIMSVDYPVENFVIINNNGRGEIDEELNRLTRITHKYIKNIKVVHMPANIGCAGAWNLIIKCYMMADYWIIANDDVAFGPGLLEEMATTIEKNPNVGMVHPNPGDFNIGAWDLFLIRDNIVKMFGLFDENTYPAYCEDADYIMRFVHRPILKVIGLKNTYYHGKDDSKNYYNSGSQTIKSDENLKKTLEEANRKNIEYLTSKWGVGWRQMRPRALPFMDQEKYIGETRYDLNFVRSKHTGF